MSPKVLTPQVYLQTPQGRIFGLQRQLSLLGWQIVPSHPSQRNAHCPKLRMHQFCLEQLDQDMLFVILLTVNNVPLSVPFLQVGECASDEGKGLRVYAAVEGTEVLKHPYCSVSRLDSTADRFEVWHDRHNDIPRKLASSTLATNRISVSDAIGWLSKRRALRLDDSSRSKRGFPQPRLALTYQLVHV
jgi:hypothetical protein